MRFHIFGNNNRKIMILIHGVLTPWQIWQEQIEHFQGEYCVIVPALDGHVEESASEFISVEDEAAKIIEYVSNNYGTTVDVLSGLSMGGAIAYRIFESRKLEINALILDGAPISPLGKLPIWFMKKSYLSIIHKSKARDRKTLENFKKNFLPEKYLPSYLKFADTMTDETVRNMLDSVFIEGIAESPVECDTRILFLHGTKGNEVVSAKAAKMMKKAYPQTEIKRFSGYAHGELAIYHIDEWLSNVDEFIHKSISSK